MPALSDPACLPPVAPAVVAEVLDALPPRLRKRVDAAVDRAAEWSVVVDGDVARVEVDEETALVWALHGGVLTSADDLVCGCLLAPKCLHRGIAVTAAEVVEPRADDLNDEAASAGRPDAETPGPGASTAEKRGASVLGSGKPGEGAPVVEVTGPERAAASALWDAASAVLRGGASGSGAVVRAELLRAVHSARVVGLHRAAAGGLRVAAALARARAGDASFDREVLSADLLDLLLLCHDLRSGTDSPAHPRGTARREYTPIGSLRLYGLFTEAVVSATGYAGVVTHLATEDGRLWTVPALMPGGRDRVAAAAGGPVALGESGHTHRALGRSGLLLTGGTASPDRRLGAGKSVRAVAAPGAAWTDPALNALWETPLADQVSRALAAHDLPDEDRPAGETLLFLDAEVLGTAGPALRVRATHTHLDLTADDDLTRQNLRLLAIAPGATHRFIARLHPDHPGTATALAVAGDLTLPTSWSTHADLSLDPLQRAHLTLPSTPPEGTPARPDALPPAHQPIPRPDRVPAPLRPLANAVHRTALGGRSIAALPDASQHAQRLSAIGLTASAAVLAALGSAARDRDRDPFGRLNADTTAAFPTAWLHAALHVRETTKSLNHHAWLAITGE